MENRIKIIRENRKLSREALANLVGCGKMQIYRMETNRVDLTLNWIERLAKALECQPYELLPDEYLPKGIHINNATISTIQTINLKLIMNIIDTLNFFLKQEKATMDDENRLKLINYLYSKSVKNEELPLAIDAWTSADPAILKGIVIDE